MQQLFSLKTLLLALCCSLFLAACGGGAKEETAVKDYLNAIASGNTDKAVAMLYFGPEDAKDAAEKAALEGKFKAMLIEMKEGVFDKNGGLKKIEITSKEFSEDKKKVTVHYTMFFGNDTQKSDSMSLVLINDVWKVAVK